MSQAGADETVFGDRSENETFIPMLGKQAPVNTISCASWDPPFAQMDVG